MNINEKQVILVTGASGFIGQHIVKLLQENDPHVKEIRCLDLNPYDNTLGHACNHSMKVITGDITNENTVIDAMRDVDVVIHCAAVIDITPQPDEGLMYKVNVEGTRILINAAINCQARFFLHMSTVDVCVGSDQVYFGSEQTTPLAKDPILGSYAITKREAEDIVLKANRRDHLDGTTCLKTLVLRPTVTYGEGDNHFIPGIFRMAKNNNGILPKIDNIFIRTQVTYAGNVAWCTLKAKEKIQTDDSIAGEIFFITDDTPISDPFDFYQPLLKLHGMTVSSWTLPYWFIIPLMIIVMAMVKLFKPLYHITLPEHMELKKIRYVGNTFFFNRNKSILRLDYEPLFSVADSESRSMNHYKKIQF